MTSNARTLKQDYSSEAPRYDAVRFSGRSGRFLYETDRDIVRQGVACARAVRILDVPTGTGRVLDYLDDTAASIIGIDATPAMLGHAKRYMRPQDGLLLGDAGMLPFADDSFDCVVSLRFFHLFDRQYRRRFAAEFARVLRPGGCVLFSMTNGWYAGGLNWAKRALGARIVHFEHAGEVRALFPGWTTEWVRGNFLPLQWVFESTPLARPLAWSTRHFPANRLSWERFHLLRKPPG